MKLILWVLQGLLRLVALCVILYYTLICSIMIVRRGPRWWMRRSWDEVYDVQDRLNELVLGNLLEKRSKMKTVTIYTDGACSGNPGPGGWGAILMYGAHRKELSGGEANTTNNRMELTAVIAALSLWSCGPIPSMSSTDCPRAGPRAGRSGAGSSPTKSPPSIPTCGTGFWS